MCGCLSCASHWGSGLQPRHVPWLGVKLATPWFTGQHSIHWATPARAGCHSSYDVNTTDDQHLDPPICEGMQNAAIPILSVLLHLVARIYKTNLPLMVYLVLLWSILYVGREDKCLVLSFYSPVFKWVIYPISSKWSNEFINLCSYFVL